MVAFRYLSLGGLALALATLAGCSSVSRGSLESIRLAVKGETVEPTAASVAASPYFQLQVNAPGGQAILILGDTGHGRLGWYGEKDAVFTRDGVVVQTVGLPQNLDSSELPADNPFRRGLQHVSGPVDYARRMDWSPGYRYGIAVQAHLEPGAIEDIEILGTVHRLRRIDERLTAPALGVHMTNRYWVDPADGFIWKSRQYVAPGFPLELIQLRPYRDGAPAADVTQTFTSGTQNNAPPPPGSRLSVASRAAHTDPDAYTLGAAWLQPGLRTDQLRLRAGLVYELGAIRRQSIGTGNDALAEGSAAFQTWLSALPITGRHPAATLDPAALDVTPAVDWPTQEGDTIFYPRRPADIRVVGAVNQACRVPHVPMQDARRYLRGCPASAAADPDMIYVVQPDGVVFEQNIALWNRSDPRPLAPGAWIYVPFARHAIAGAADDTFNHDVADFLATQILSDDSWQ